MLVGYPIQRKSVVLFFIFRSTT